MSYRWQMALLALIFILYIIPLNSPAFATEGMVGYWKFDEGAGDVLLDYSGYGSNGIIHNGAWSPDGLIDKCLYFNGVNSSVEIADRDWNTGSPVTFMLWYKIDGSWSVDSTLFQHSWDAVPGAYTSSPGQPSFVCYDGFGTPRQTYDPAVPLNTWIFYTVTVSDSQINLYINGTLRRSNSITGGLPKLAGSLLMGYDKPNNSFFFKGWIDEFSIFNRVLDVEEIQQIYQDYLLGFPLSTPFDGPRVMGFALDKIFYPAGGTGIGTVSLKNFSAVDESCTLTVKSVTRLAQERTLYSEDLTLPANAFEQRQVPLAFVSEDYGCEVYAELSRQGIALNRMSDLASVSDNLWKVGIGGRMIPSVVTSTTNPNYIDDMIKRNVDHYANWLDMFFWAPDEWGNLAPVPDWWYSGQCSYFVRKENLKSLTSKAHQYGIKVLTYGKHVAEGPDGWEMVRRHLEWFRLNQFTQPAGYYDTYLLDNWNNSALRDSGTVEFPDSLFAYPDFRQVEPLDWGIEQLIQSAREYGWDGVRYDGHYTAGNDELSTWNMRHLKETIHAELPDFLLGFNYGHSPEAFLGGINHEMREGMAGGGMYTQEAIQYWGYTPAVNYTSWRDFAENELLVAKQIQALGGAYHAVYQFGGTPTGMYKLIYALISGGHSYYGAHENPPGCDNWGKFMTRWSAFLWNLRLRTVADPAARVSVETASPVYWQPLMQEFVDSPTRKYQVIHLVNPSPDDLIANTTLPGSLDNVTVHYTPDESSVERMVLVQPEAEPYDTVLQPEVADGVYTVTIPRLNYWAMVIVELNGTFIVPPDPPTFSEEPDPEAVEAGRQSQLGTPSMDPLEPPARIILAPNEMLYETDNAYNSVPAVSAFDPDALNGIAQVRDEGVQWEYMGRSWMGPLAPGRYVVRFRAKLEDTTQPINQQYVNWSIYTYQPEPVNYFVLYDTDPMRVPPERQLVVDGTYHNYNFPEIDLRETDFISIIGGPEVVGDRENRFLMDHFVITQVEKYTDEQQEEWFPTTKPDGLRTPNGASPQSILQVRGMHWQPFGVEEIFSCTGDYSLPETYEEAYAYDAIVLTNIELTYSSHVTRKILRDFVADGGRLVILGGEFTLGQGNFQGTYLEEMLPVTLSGLHEVSPCTPSLLGMKANIPFSDLPELYWRHDVAARTGAESLAFAGASPVAVRGHYGNGVVVVFAGTVLGSGDNPFWTCESWSALLSQIVKSTGYEGDVAPRQTGNNAVSIADWVQVGRLVVGLDDIQPGMEFRRADCAPRDGLGDGIVDASDWVQTGKYAIGLDPLTAEGGFDTVQQSAQAALAVKAVEKTPPSGHLKSATREVTVAGTILHRGQTSAVSLTLTGLGNENALGFTLHFDPGRLRFVSATTPDPTNTLLLNATQKAQGRIALCLMRPLPQTFPAGTTSVIALTFTVPDQAKSGATTITFNDAITRCVVVDATAAKQPTTFNEGMVIIRK